MEVALVLLAAGFVVTLTMLVMGKRTSASAPAGQTQEAPRLRQLETELDRRKKDVEEQKRQMAELKDELKQTKRKLFEEREGQKENRDLVKARQEEERNAAQQLEIVRAELASAQAEIDRLRTETTRRPRGEGGPAASGVKLAVSPDGAVTAAPADTAPAAVPAAAPAPVPEVERPRRERVIRELSDADKEKMDLAQHEARKARQKAAELEGELRRLKSKLETEKRMFAVTKGEADLLRDKFKALEKRTNRKLLENDLLRRAIKDLEKKTGITAERTELTAEEAAASDHAVDERALQDAAKDAERRALEETARARADAENASAMAAAESATAAPSESAPASPQVETSTEQVTPPREQS